MSSNDDIVKFREGTFNYTKNKWVGQGSKNLNDVNAQPPSRSEAISDETSSITSTGSNESLQTVATDLSLDTNASGASTGTVNTDLDVTDGSSAIPSSVKSSADGRYDVDMDVVADYNPRKKHDTINTKTFAKPKQFE
jgi:hypothetical protein